MTGPVELAGIDDDTADRVAVTADILVQGVDHEKLGSEQNGTYLSFFGTNRVRLD